MQTTSKHIVGLGHQISMIEGKNHYLDFAYIPKTIQRK